MERQTSAMGSSRVRRKNKGQPTVHEGYHARKLESMGIVSDRCELNRQIREDNKLLRELKKTGAEADESSQKKYPCPRFCIGKST